jgi:hypothetical protein
MIPTQSKRSRRMVYPVMFGPRGGQFLFQYDTETKQYKKRYLKGKQRSKAQSPVSSSSPNLHLTDRLSP